MHSSPSTSLAMQKGGRKRQTAGLTNQCLNRRTTPNDRPHGPEIQRKDTMDISVPKPGWREPRRGASRRTTTRTAWWRIAHRALLAAIVGAGIAASATAVSAMSAHAWAGKCGGGGCYNRDPVSAGCATDAYTAASTSYYSTSRRQWIKIELRYSPSCQANWAKISPAPAGWQFYSQDGWGNRIPNETVRYNASSWYGNMVDGARRSSACFLNGVCASG